MATSDSIYYRGMVHTTKYLSILYEMGGCAAGPKCISDLQFLNFQWGV